MPNGSRNVAVPRRRCGLPANRLDSIFSRRNESRRSQQGDALRRLHIAQEQRTALLGYANDTVPEEATAGDVLSRVEIRAPFAGTIEEKHFAPSDRVKPADVIFVLADTKSLWVAADIREQDWLALGLEPGQELSVDTPALPGCTLKARFKRTGRRVSPETNSVSLVAEIANPNGLLRPGLFVRVSIPIGPPKDVLCTPAAAVVQHEGAKFVFVQTGPKTFRRADVTTGLDHRRGRRNRERSQDRRTDRRARGHGAQGGNARSDAGEGGLTCFRA